MANAQLNGVLRHLRSVRETQALAEAPDAQLLERFMLRRDEPAFAALVRRHGAMVLSVSERVLHQRQDAEDGRCGIGASRTTAHKCSRQSSPTNCWCATTIVLATITPASAGS